MASAIWYITPHLREKVAYLKYIACFLPWALFYLFLIITQPTEIVLGKSYGYELILTGQYPLYLSIAQGSFIAIMLGLCIWGYVKYKHSQLRSQYIAMILALITLALDGVSYYIPVFSLFPPFTLSEIFGFLAILYAYANKPLRIIGEK